jgi:predicted aminopeptidase
LSRRYFSVPGVCLGWLVLTLLLSGCQIGYLVKQGYVQARLLAQRRPVEEVLADPSVAVPVKAKIRLVQRVCEYGRTALGLEVDDAYKSYIEIKGRVLAYVVSAAYKDRLEPYTWRFPIVGRLPYKGFFDLTDAEAQASALGKRGYDTALSVATAFSSLGWFADPLYSSMTDLSEIDLTYTILHELVHGTIFFEDHVDFNEQLATFIGWQAALQFLREVHGTAAPVLEKAREVIHDEKLLNTFLSRAYEQLTIYYGQDLPSEEILESRPDLFHKLQGDFKDYLPRFKTARFAGLAHLQWNNAVFLALWRYRYNTGSLEDLYLKLDRNLAAFIQTVKGWQKQGKDPDTLLARIIHEK